MDQSGQAMMPREGLWQENVKWYPAIFTSSFIIPAYKRV
jgi:hypothetical protein